jgi:signal transduction histidine kinase
MDNIKNDEITFLSRKILELNKQLIESEKAKSRFLSLIASELNNPMTVLLGMIPHLAPPIGDPKENFFALIHEEALLLEFRIQNLVAAAEIESGSMDITYALVDPSELVLEAIEDLKYLIQSKNLIVSIENTMKDKIVSDPKKLYSIIINLLSNACQYGIDEGHIEIILSQSETMFLVSIINQGKAPDVEFKPQVFTRFSQGPDGVHGLGLGLSVVRDLCEHLDGNIDYVAENNIVNFTVILPLETTVSTSDACGSNEFLFESFDDAIEL